MWAPADTFFFEFCIYLNSITVKKCEISDTFLILGLASIESEQKTAYKTFKWLVGIFKRFSSYCCFKCENKPKYRKNPVGTSLKTRFQQLITQEKLEKPGNRLNVLYVVFCKLSNDASHLC